MSSGKSAVLENPPGITYEFLRGCNIPTVAKQYLREIAAEKGFSEARTLSLVILEHQALTRTG